jgi:DNA repair protein RadC
LIVHPRGVFRGAIAATSAIIILAHNHPSGNLEASQEDIQMTKQLVDAGNIIGIKVYDHIIFVENAYTELVNRNETNNLFI